MNGELTRIVLVEDDPDIQVIALQALREVGRFAIEICNSGAEALSKIPRYNPDLVLMDVMMPGLDGPATLRRLKEDPATANIPVIFLSAVQTSEALRGSLGRDRQAPQSQDPGGGRPIDLAEMP